MFGVSESPPRVAAATNGLTTAGCGGIGGAAYFARKLRARGERQGFRFITAGVLPAQANVKQWPTISDNLERCREHAAASSFSMRSRFSNGDLMDRKRMEKLIGWEDVPCQCTSGHRRRGARGRQRKPKLVTSDFCAPPECIVFAANLVVHINDRG